MLLKELFDKIVDYKGPSTSKGLTMYTFKIDDLNYLVKFTDVKIENIEYDFNIIVDSKDDLPTHITEISFGINKGYKIDMEISDTGNSIQVFSTVIDIIKTQVQNIKYPFITFSAKESSREKLYNRIAQSLTSKIPYKLVDTFNDSEGKNYILQKK
jgi:hypothetical protein